MNEKLIKDDKATWLDHYLGQSEIGNIAENSIVQNFKGDSYLTWAMMVRVLFTLDADASWEFVENEHGGFIFSDHHKIETYDESDGKVKKTSFDQYALFVKVEVTYKGRVFKERMNIRNKDGSAAKTLDSSMILNSQQRALAKCISVATGVGLRMWSKEEEMEIKGEGTQLVQEKPKATKPKPKAAPKTVKKEEVKEEVKEEPKPTPKPTPKVEEVEVPEPISDIPKPELDPIITDELPNFGLEESGQVTDKILETAMAIKDNYKTIPVISALIKATNNTLTDKIDLEASVEEIASSISNAAKPQTLCDNIARVLSNNKN